MTEEDLFKERYRVSSEYEPVVVYSSACCRTHFAFYAYNIAVRALALLFLVLPGGLLLWLGVHEVRRAPGRVTHAANAKLFAELSRAVRDRSRDVAFAVSPSTGWDGIHHPADVEAIIARAPPLPPPPESDASSDVMLSEAPFV